MSLRKVARSLLQEWRDTPKTTKRSISKKSTTTKTKSKTKTQKRASLKKEWFVGLVFYYPRKWGVFRVVIDEPEIFTIKIPKSKAKTKKKAIAIAKRKFMQKIIKKVTQLISKDPLASAIKKKYGSVEKYVKKEVVKGWEKKIKVESAELI